MSWSPARTNDTVPQQWTIPRKQLAELLRLLQLKPKSGSPLQSISEPAAAIQGTDTQVASIEPSPGLRRALTAVVSPEVSIGLAHVPPEQSHLAWFYGLRDETSLTLYDDGVAGEVYLCSPIPMTQVMEIIGAALAFQQPGFPEGFALQMDRAQLETTAAIVDFVQERALLSTIRRTVAPSTLFTASDLSSCCYRTLRGHDQRWMLHRVRALSPLPVGANLEGLRRGLIALVEQGLLVRHGEIYEPSEEFGLVCGLLGAASSGLCALSVRRRDNESNRSRWTHEHLGAVRGIGAPWLFEFSAITDCDFLVTIGDYTPELIQLRFQAALRLPEPTDGPMAVASGSDRPQPVGELYCRGCGATIKPGLNYCTTCGKRIHDVTAEMPLTDAGSSQAT